MVRKGSKPSSGEVLNKLAFGRWREGTGVTAQVYVYLRSPTHAKAQKISLMFCRYSPQIGNTNMSNEDVSRVDNRFNIGDLWRVFVSEDRRVNLSAFRAVLKALYVRKGLNLSAPIPVNEATFHGLKLLLALSSIK
jgi:hypothetical protein